MNPAAAVRGPKHVVTKGATPVLSPAGARKLLENPGDLLAHVSPLGWEHIQPDGGIPLAGRAAGPGSGWRYPQFGHYQSAPPCHLVADGQRRRLMESQESRSGQRHRL